MSDTPRTDAKMASIAEQVAAWRRGSPMQIPLEQMEEHARTLERENSALREALRRILAHDYDAFTGPSDIAQAALAGSEVTSDSRCPACFGQWTDHATKCPNRLIGQPPSDGGDFVSVPREVAERALSDLVELRGLEPVRRDWGCDLCHPDSHMLDGSGFRCHFHRLQAAIGQGNTNMADIVDRLNPATCDPTLAGMLKAMGDGAEEIMRLRREVHAARSVIVAIRDLGPGSGANPNALKDALDHARAYCAHRGIGATEPLSAGSGPNG